MILTISEMYLFPKKGCYNIKILFTIFEKGVDEVKETTVNGVMMRFLSVCVASVS
jgi:hypothetical protein